MESSARMDTAPLVRTDISNGVATITLDRPAARNALSNAMIEELIAAFATVATDDSVRVVVLSHTGPAFCAGADLTETAAAVASGDVPAARLGQVLTAIVECPRPVIARVAGAARAGGIGLIAAADLAVCTHEATFAFSEVRIGVIPAVISATVLPRLNSRAAAELYLTGSTFNGVRAAEIGLVTRAVPAQRLDEVVAGYCAALLRGAPQALAGTKQLLQRTRRADLHDELRDLTRLSVEYFRSAEAREGMAAFREKRDPAWVRSHHVNATGQGE